MDMHELADRLLEKAQHEGLVAEVWGQAAESMRVKVQDTALEEYRISTRQSLGIRAMVNGRMGYASTEAFDEQSIDQLLNGVKESAELNESPDQETIFPGEERYPVLTPPESDLEQVEAAQIIDAAFALEKAAKEADNRISKVQHPSASVNRSRFIMRNTHGLDLRWNDSLWVASLSCVAQRSSGAVTDFDFGCGRKWAELDPGKIAAHAAEKTLMQLDASSIPSGNYRVLFENSAMADLLATYCGIFSAENVLQHLSLLNKREGSAVASSAVTLMDDPLLPGGFASCYFDMEGCAAQTKAVIENGVLQTLLHNRKTAAKYGAKSTGNAQRGGGSSPLTVAPTNLFFKPGQHSLAEMMESIGSGLVITEVSGLHAGANTISGDFSLLAKGYLVENGKRGQSVEQITVAGNFYRLLENIVEVGSDLFFPGSGVGSPSVDAGMLMIAGK